MYGEGFDKCTGCSEHIVNASKENKEDFLIKACNEPDYLEDVTGIKKMNEEINFDDI
jgi:ubiquitin-like modifier-activating enzyme ATG7